MSPKANEIWRTKSGNEVLVVSDPTRPPNGLGFIWFDEEDGTMSYCPLEDQLDVLVSGHLEDWAIKMEDAISNRESAPS